MGQRHTRSVSSLEHTHPSTPAAAFRKVGSQGLPAHGGGERSQFDEAQSSTGLQQPLPSHPWSWIVPDGTVRAGLSSLPEGRKEPAILESCGLGWGKSKAPGTLSSSCSEHWFRAEGGQIAFGSGWCL